MPQFTLLSRSALAITSGLLLFASACVDRETAEPVPPAPVGATAYPSPSASVGPIVNSPPQDIQLLRVTIDGGRFNADIYDVQIRSTRLQITTVGGPYQFRIESLVQERTLAPDSNIEVALSPSAAGTFTMQVSGNGSDTAVLNVRAAGER